jgi:hypothetical protein
MSSRADSAAQHGKNATIHHQSAGEWKAESRVLSENGPYRTNADSGKTGSLQTSEVDDSVPETSALCSDAPDGGSRAWLVVFGAWCSSFCTWGWINGMWRIST